MQKSSIRYFLGRVYHNISRRLFWYSKRNIFGDVDSSTSLPVCVFEHRTPLFRKLHGTDEQLQKNKVMNLRLAIARIDGLLLRPGELFSFWRLVGRPSSHKGYLPGLILRSGTIDAGIGGGLCQLTNLLFWIFLHSPLKVEERWHHGYDVFPDVRRTQPFGSGATCSYPNIDLVVANQTEDTFQVVLEVTETHLVGRLLGERTLDVRYEIRESDHAIWQDFDGRYRRSNKIRRLTFDERTRECLFEELITTNDAVMMYQPLLESSYGTKG